MYKLHGVANYHSRD